MTAARLVAGRALVILAVAACWGTSLEPARSSTVEDIPIPAAAQEWGPATPFEANYQGAVYHLRPTGRLVRHPTAGGAPLAPAISSAS